MCDKHTCKYAKSQASILACFVPGALYEGQYTPKNFQVQSPVIPKLQKVLCPSELP